MAILCKHFAGFERQFAQSRNVHPGPCPRQNPPRYSESLRERGAVVRIHVDHRYPVLGCGPSAKTPQPDRDRNFSLVGSSEFVRHFPTAFIAFISWTRHNLRRVQNRQRLRRRRRRTRFRAEFHEPKTASTMPPPVRQLERRQQPQVPQNFEFCLALPNRCRASITPPAPLRPASTARCTEASSSAAIVWIRFFSGGV